MLFLKYAGLFRKKCEGGSTWTGDLVIVFLPLFFLFLCPSTLFIFGNLIAAIYSNQSAGKGHNKSADSSKIKQFIVIRVSQDA